MTPDTAPLTVIQSHADPEWAGLVRRFWRVREQPAECVYCGSVFEAHPANRRPALYCSNSCRSQAWRDKERAA